MTETEKCEFALEQAPATTTRGFWDRVAALVNYVDSCLEIRRQRRALCLMEDHQLKDVGLNRADVDCEAARNFWDVGKR